MRWLACVALLVGMGSWAFAQELIVFAASSLTEAFEEIAASFEAQHPGVDVAIAFGGSSTLALQLLQGAPADVFASADPEQMQRVADAGLLAGPPMTFARNRLVVLADPAAGLATPADLARDDLLLVLGAPDVPAGNYARRTLARLDARYGRGWSERVLANVVSEEPNVRQVVAKIALGQADAAIAYATDARVAPNLAVLELPEPFTVDAHYRIATLRRSPAGSVADAFVAFVSAPEAQAILTRFGFRAAE